MKAPRFDTIRFAFPDAVNINESLVSPPMEACGYNWRMEFMNVSSEENEFVKENDFVVFLHAETKVSALSDIFFRTRFRWKGQDGRSEFEDLDFAYLERPWEKHDGFVVRLTESLFPYSERMNGQMLANNLEDDGSFVVEFDIEFSDEKNTVWFPMEIQKKSELLVQQFFEPHDVFFKVEGRIFGVHRNVLAAAQYNVLVAAQSNNWLSLPSSRDSPIPLKSVSQQTFAIILRFLYTLDTEPTFETEQLAEEVLTAANFFGCVPLKLYTESVLVQQYLSVENAISFWILADSLYCALLKESSIKLMVEEKIYETIDSNELLSEPNKYKLCSELMSALKDEKRTLTDNNKGRSKMTVTSLRRELEDVNEELDGSRRMLVNRLYSAWYKITKKEPRTPAIDRKMRVMLEHED